MVKYTIKMLQRASDDLDNIYNHIADDFKEIGTAEKMADALEDAVLSLEEMPYRGSGNYASDEAKEIARLQRELRDAKDALNVLKKAISILDK